MSIKLEEFDWSTLEPGDGYSVELVQSGDVLAEIIFYCKQQGRIVISEKLHSVKMPTHIEIADLRRRMILYNAIAEYLNAGGEQAEKMCRNVQNTMLGSFVFPGWNYFNHGVTEDVNHVHEFISDTPPFKYVKWVRNEFIDIDLNEQEMIDEYYDSADNSTNLNIVGDIS